MNKNKKVYNKSGKLVSISEVKFGEFKEHCEFKDAPCNYHGLGWYDRCAWCKDNNGFIRKHEDLSKPF